jgi:hypothetical protein
MFIFLVILGIAIVWLLQILWGNRWAVVGFLLVCMVIGAVGEGIETIRHGTVASRLEGVTFTPIRTYDASSRNVAAGTNRQAVVEIDNQSDRVIDNIDGYCGDIYISDPKPVPAKTKVTREYYYIVSDARLGECVIDDVDIVT